MNPNKTGLPWGDSRERLEALRTAVMATIGPHRVSWAHTMRQAVPSLIRPHQGVLFQGRGTRVEMVGTRGLRALIDCCHKRPSFKGRRYPPLSYWLTVELYGVVPGDEDCFQALVSQWGVWVETMSGLGFVTRDGVYDTPKRLVAEGDGRSQAFVEAEAWWELTVDDADKVGQVLAQLVDLDVDSLQSLWNRVPLSDRPFR